MTAGNNGSDTPENDDPFAYLYRSEGDQGQQGGQSGQPGAAPRTGGYGYPGPAQPGVPRTSYNHVRAVGERTYGQQIPNQQPQGYGQQGGPGRQNAYYAAPETLPGGAPRQPGAAAPRGGHGGGGRGPNNKGLLIGAIAVVAVVIVGIGVAMITNGDDKKDDQADPTNQPTASASAQPSGSAGASKDPDEDLPAEDAAKMRLAGGAATASDIQGAKAEGGTYVGGLNTPGASATWTVDVAKAKSYRLYVTYGVPGEDQSMSLTINGKKESRPLNMKNFAGAPKGDYEKGWTETWSIVQLNKGTNTITVSCENGDKCDANIDQMWLDKG
ncbi:carbohydrate-binding protein [Streptomyces luomodiensis]|uniref:Carbohydrate-binding protein n=1 Tax=Streptomyces luomodiensis TaxID=3026192 RepID=A0ABY9UZQ4_9ACTN|nr:carbohydrate-binding protein [Streptomyces sp. SCA4-21]WNE97275.1 carbohydrate-binding protein [Streptomyces sp. SCA4-21]